MCFFKSSIPYPNTLKTFLLGIYGSRIGRGIIIKPRVNIKFPWLLEIGNDVWIGEEVWIDNLAQVTIGNNVCISQGAYLCTGSHDFKKETFDILLGPITIEDGVWVGAKVLVAPGVTLRSHSVIAAGGVIMKNTEPYMIYLGNPASLVKKRDIE
jgi:putative colanic acid biosynthesis acetyltransferase WcaF